MAIVNEELKRECCPQHLPMGTASLTYDKDTEEEGKKRRVNIIIIIILLKQDYKIQLANKIQLAWLTSRLVLGNI